MEDKTSSTSNNKLRDKLNNVPHDIDKDRLWEDIERDLPVKKRKFVLFLLFSGLFLAAFFTLFGYQLYFSDWRMNYSIILPKTTTFSTDSSNGTPRKIVFEQQLPPETESIDLEKETPTVASSAKVASTVSSDEISEYTIPEQQSSITSTQPIATTSNSQATQPIIPTAQSSGEQYATAGKRSSTATYSTDNTKEKQAKQQQVSLAANRTTPSTIPASTLQAVEAVPPITKLIIPTLGLDRVILLPSEEDALSVYPIRRFSIAAYQGVGMVRTTFNLVNSEQATQLESRQSTERNLESLTTGIVVSWDLTPSLFLEVGMERQQITTRLSGDVKEEITITTESDSAYVYTDPAGRLNYLSGTTTVRQITTLAVQNYNHNILYNIPIAVGVKKRFNRLAVVLRGGGVFNLQHSFSGEFITPESSLLDANSIQQAGTFERNIGLGWQAGLGLEYRIAPRLDVLFSMHHRQYLDSFTAADLAGYEQRVQITGVQLGLKQAF